MHNTIIYENILQRLLEQSLAGNMAAAVLLGNPGTATLYNPTLLAKIVADDYKANGNKSYIDSEYEILLPAILGFVSIRKAQDSTTGPCWGAWEVTRIAGKGYGKIMYGLAYDMADNNLIMPDRRNLTDDSISSWRSAADKNIPTKPFRNIRDRDPKDPLEKDHCLCWKDSALDAAYEYQPNILPGLEASHDEMAGKIYKLCRINVNKLAQAITNAGDTFFNQNYPRG